MNLFFRVLKPVETLLQEYKIQSFDMKKMVLLGIQNFGFWFREENDKNKIETDQLFNLTFSLLLSNLDFFKINVVNSTQTLGFYFEYPGVEDLK